jgi:hypothetical protein
MGSKVPRTTWLALICLISLGVLIAVKSNIGARPISVETTSVPASSADLPPDEGPPLAKSDRLPSPYFDKSAVKPADTVQSGPTVPEAAKMPDRKQVGDAASQAKPEVSEVRTWHWHTGSRVTKRTTVVEPADKQPAR